ncbi:hypothetical protein PHLGIDRAFT_241658 [Phlebiopsis gigantea 11061_1 CR5-6]|uniref:F-box domain-containing protein n=1 Tax=Phlebiopsis gigantea (strain 11061_1 CR5-6) TaxID=745531 RepID=A0A0C3S438_PHLG1|nr:hypothetical protein PHLGIDRAFT_241658 [Phlebiopsis gigantea 11061_1 CR5-6]
MSQARAVPLRQLPIELLSPILGPLDKPTLAACSLVARSWVYTARMYLFRSITYRVNAEIHYGVHQTPPPLHDLLYFLPSCCSFSRSGSPLRSEEVGSTSSTPYYDVLRVCSP